jgi:DNA-binding transcriptional regulator YiaG
MSKIVTIGPRRIVDDVWHDDNGPLPGSPGGWDPPMTDDEVMLAALSDRDAQPLTDGQLAGMRRVSPARIARRKAQLSAAEFAERYHLPVEQLRAWERHDAVPDPAIEAYLWVIAADPAGVAATVADRRKSVAAE